MSSWRGVGLAAHRGMAAAAAAVLVIGIGACGRPGLSFIQDDRVEIISPVDRDMVSLPLTIRWTAGDVDLGDGAGVFAVFVDRPPVPPGRTLDWLFRDDDACRRTPGCPDAAFLETRDIYVTVEPAVRISQVPQDGPDGRGQFHEATIVLLDDREQRTSEAAWSVRFRLSEP